MFGQSKDLTETLTKEVARGHWDKLKKKYLRGSKEEQLALAKACKTVSSDDSVNTLINLMSSAVDDEVLIEVLRSLGDVGTDHAVSQIQLLMTTVDKENKAVYPVLMDTLGKLRNKG